MLLKADKCCLLMVDVQERLVPAIHEHEQLVANCAWLIGVADAVNVPVLVSEQYPRGLGPTVRPLKELVPQDNIIEKVHFSCGASPDCLERINDISGGQVVVAGIEAHVCVLQTALDLVDSGKDVFVVADAVSSRDPRDAELAIERMREAGVKVITREMALFEWAHKAGTQHFKALSNQFLK
jgi:nicotinamidase-related amidase